MQRGPQQDQTFEKLKSLLASRFGKSIELRRLSDARYLDTEKTHLLLNEDLHIPLRIENAYLGTAVIPQAADLPEENHHQIAQVVRMILEPTLYRDFLERSESNLRNARNEELPPLPSLNDRDLADEDEEDAAEPGESVPLASLDAPVLVSNLVHLSSQDVQRLKKTALLFQEITGRWAFVPLDDILGEMTTASDFVKLGAMTLFVENVETLPPDFQSLLLDYLGNPRSAQDPLVITGSSKTSLELSHSPFLHPDLIDELTVNTIELDRSPLTERGLKEVLQLMFFETKGEA